MTKPQFSQTPFQLYHVHDVKGLTNADQYSLPQILREAWANYLKQRDDMRSIKEYLLHHSKILACSIQKGIFIAPSTKTIQDVEHRPGANNAL